MKHYEMLFLLLFCIFTKISCQLLSRKEDIKVSIGREVYINPSDLQFINSTDDTVCKVEVVMNEPMTQRVGLLEPQVYVICDFENIIYAL